MTLASIRLQQLRREIGDAPAAQKRLVEAQEAINGAIERLRRMIFELHSPVLESDGLHAAIEEYLAETFDDGVACTVIGDADGLASRTAALAYRLAREAIFNSFKHADPTAVEVALSATGETLTVEVSDNGRGFDPGAIDNGSGHIGLDHSRQLARAAGGTWSCTSAPGQGTSITFSLPRRFPA
jgi:signal transduction histidine kinase